MRCVILSENTLPPKPIDPTGRPVWWVDILSEDTIFSAGGERHRVGVDGIERQLAAFTYMTSRGYMPPVGGDHEHPFSMLSSVPALAEAMAAMPPGWRQGDLLDMDLWEDGAGKLHAIGAVALALPAEAAEAAVALGAVKYFSPELGPLELDDGSVLPLVVKKLDIVERPHQKGAPSHILASEDKMSDKAEATTAPENTSEMGEAEITLAELAELVAANAASIEAIRQSLEAAEAEAEPEAEDEAEAKPEDEDEAEMSEASVALSEAKAKIQALEAQRDEATFAHLVPEGATVELNEAVRAMLLSAYRQDPEGWIDGIGRAITVPSHLEAATLSEAQMAWTRQVGTQVAPLPKDEASPEVVYAQCLAEANGDAIEAHRIFKTKRLN